jgi:hypothetical protein
MQPAPLARSRRAAARLAAVPCALTGLALIALGVLVLSGANPFGWFGVGAGAGVLLLAFAGLLLSDWSVALFGGLFVLALCTLAAGAAGDADGFLLVGIVCLVLVGCTAALTHQLGRVAEAAAGRAHDGAD